MGEAPSGVPENPPSWSSLPAATDVDRRPRAAGDILEPLAKRLPAARQTDFMAQLSTIYRDSPPAQRELPERSLEPSTDRAARVSRAARAAAAARRALSTGSSSSSSCRPTFSSSTGSRAIDGPQGLQEMYSDELSSRSSTTGAARETFC